MYIAKQSDFEFTKPMNEEVNDEQLMLQYAKGDMTAFEKLYARHKGGLYRYCLRQLSNHSIAEECFQEIWMKVIASRVNYRPKALFSTYLYRIAQNHIIDTYRKNKKLSQETTFEDEYQSLPDENFEADISSILSEKHKYALLRQKIESLPIDQKTALLLNMDTGFSLEQIGEILGCGRETIKSRLRYAVNRLKILLGENL